MISYLPLWPLLILPAWTNRLVWAHLLPKGVGQALERSARTCSGVCCEVVTERPKKMKTQKMNSLQHLFLVQGRTHNQHTEGPMFNPQHLQFKGSQMEGDGIDCSLKRPWRVVLIWVDGTDWPRNLRTCLLQKQTIGPSRSIFKTDWQQPSRVWRFHFPFHLGVFHWKCQGLHQGPSACNMSYETDFYWITPVVQPSQYYQLRLATIPRVWSGYDLLHHL